jgi:hypothetical protein
MKKREKRPLRRSERRSQICKNHQFAGKNAENSPKIKSPPGGGSLHTSSTKKNSTTQNFVKRYFNLFLGGPIRLVFQNPHSHPPYPSSATKFLASA